MSEILEFEPNYNRVFVELLNDQEEDVSKGGIYIPESAKGKKIMIKGKVLKTGPGMFVDVPSSPLYGKYLPMDVVPGDVVTFATVDVTMISKTVGVVSEDDCWCRDLREGEK
jgi:co-chaperonin GroES (HSP10)